LKVFHCNHCDQLLFFENTTCLGCGRQVAYLPDVSLMSSLDPLPDGTWRSPGTDSEQKTYRLCTNYTDEQVCNWAVPCSDPQPLCVSCRLTRAIPDLSQDGQRQAWYRLEVAKRRVLFTLLQLDLPVRSREEDQDQGLAFEFKGDVGEEGVLTGHANGVITINVAEADDVERERQKKAVHEPYRTLVGHVRHEVGHYYWERLIAAGPDIDAFREMFGDERKDYAAALQAHYEQGPQPDWQNNFVSAYASSHPWEDWAETWAHYLHMVDALETAATCGLSLRPKHPDEPSMPKVPAVHPFKLDFSSLIDHWHPLTYALNNFNRGLGLPDAYPFVLSTPVIDKLRYVHDSIGRAKPLASGLGKTQSADHRAAADGIKNGEGVQGSESEPVSTQP
jgi:hypothetical protein